MQKVPGYMFSEIVSRGASSNVYRALHEQENRFYLLKTPNDNITGLSHLDQFKWESQVMASLDVPGVLSKVDLRMEHGEPFLVMDDFEGISWELLERPNFDLQDFLITAVRVAEVVGEIHEKGVVHKSICPANILVNPRNGEVRLIGFGFSTRLIREFSDFLELKNQVDDFAYMAPEQTGRMNSDMDYRVDWYALGAAFYRILSGHKPFPGKDPMDLVYAHIARYPRNLHYLNPRIPEMVSAIVSKMMAKQPEERYQSKHGLIGDLQQCLDQLRKKGQVGRFELGCNDVSAIFNIPRTLYGRAEEVALLMKQFDQVAQGSKAVMYISGYAGVGKSSVIWEIHRPIAARRGFFLAGKFDQYNRSMPYLALISAFRGMIRQIMASGKEQVEFWRNEILDAAGANGKLLVDVIPELSLLIGKRPDVPVLPPAESQNRFRAVFSNFIRLFAAKDHPLVLFLDDLQWADVPSLKMLESILLDPESNYLMVICSYRDQEMAEGHPFMVTRELVRGQAIVTQEIKLKPLGQRVVREFIADILSCSVPEVDDLARMCQQKTGGNPFFLRQFLMAIEQKKFIYFDSRAGRWQWSGKEIAKAQITENVADLMAAQIQRLPEKTRTLLKTASCLGGQFDLGSLALVSGMDVMEAREYLWPALENGLIRPRNERYKFVSERQDAFLVFYYFLHDRIQQSSYSLIPPESLPLVHLNLGRVLLRQLENELLERRLFEVVNHLLQGVSLIDDPAEKETLAKLLLRAGIRAKESSVFKLACEYLENALRLMSERHWGSHFKYMRDLHLEAAEVFYFHQRLDDMEGLLFKLLSKITSWKDKRRAFEIRVQGYVASYDWEKAFDAGIAGLNELGMDLPRNPDKISVDRYLRDAIDAVERIGVKNIPDRPELSDPRALNQVLLMATVLTPAFHMDLNLFAMMAAKNVSMAIEKGHVPVSSYLYACFCIVVVNDHPELAYDLGRSAIKLARGSSSLKAHGRTVFTIHGNVSYRKQPIVDLVDKFLDPYSLLIESGDVEFAAFTLLYHLMFSFAAGSRPLIELESTFERWCKVLERLNVGYPVASLYYQAVLDLVGKEDSPELFCGQRFNRTQVEPLFMEKKDHFSLSLFYTLEMMLAFMLGNTKDAWVAQQNARAYGAADAHEYNTSLYFSFACLVLLSRLEQDGLANQDHIWREVKGYQKSMAIWARQAPANFLARWHLVEGEIARLDRDEERLICHYDQAMALASKNGNWWERALVNELYGRYWLRRNTHHMAGVFLRRAASCYMAWGAFTKVRRMKQNYGSLLDQPNDENISTDNNRWNEFDLASIIKAAQVISGEIVLADVLKRLMLIAMENAGAQRGFLLYENNRQWIVAAQGNPDEARVFLNEMQPMDDTALLSRGVCRYVINTGDTVVLQDASENEIWDNDPYVRQHRPKSLFCMPIVHKNNTTAVLYLENNLRRAVFTDNHRRVLGMLATQAAISLENAGLYAELEHKVEARTEELRFKNEQILGSIRYAKRIQDGILPDPRAYESSALKMFVTFMPKDIVSGDFYWLKRQGSKTFVAVIDCTGHGVPGSLMSMIGKLLLTQVFNDLVTDDLAQIMETLSVSLRKVLGIDSPRSPDGMEMALCCVDEVDAQFRFCGAYQPLYYVRNGRLHEIKGVRRSVGDLATLEKNHFVSHHLEMQPGDVFYLTTDGYADQVSPELKRFGKTRLKNFLTDISEYELADQQKALEQNLRTYRGNQPLRDDITILGLRITK